MIGHGGIMGIIECLSSRLPMLFYPTTAEQNYNSKMIEEGGVGWIVKIDELAQQIHFVMDNRQTLEEKIAQFWLKSTKPGGARYSVEMFQHFSNVGTDHMLPRHRSSILVRMNWDVLVSLLLLVVSMILCCSFLCKSLFRCLITGSSKLKTD